jgi:hypothetical protein
VIPFALHFKTDVSPSGRDCDDDTPFCGDLFKFQKGGPHFGKRLDVSGRGRVDEGRRKEEDG